MDRGEKKYWGRFDLPPILHGGLIKKPHDDSFQKVAGELKRNAGGQAMLSKPERLFGLGLLSEAPLIEIGGKQSSIRLIKTRLAWDMGRACVRVLKVR